MCRAQRTTHRSQFSSFFQVGPRSPTQVIRFDDRCFYPGSQPTCILHRKAYKCMLRLPIILFTHSASTTEQPPGPVYRTETRHLLSAFQTPGTGARDGVSV